MHREAHAPNAEAGVEPADGCAGGIRPPLSCMRRRILRGASTSKELTRDAVSSPPGDVTRLLLAWSKGDRDALEGLIPVVYGELRRIADRYFRHERPDQTLQPTALVHEAYFKLIDQDHAHWQNRAQFFGVAAQLMRRILVDHARTRGAVKRGGGVSPVTLVDAAGASPPRGVDVIALDDALTRLTRLYPEQGRLVELRYFGGLTIEETGEAMGISPATVKRQWTVARAWLLVHLNPEAKV
jgi:RNA polymerase sigma factor (TIGR02999 family)